jgi:hypothetical protein
MQKFSVLALLSLSFFFSQAQEFKVSYSEEMKFDLAESNMLPFSNGFINLEVINNKKQLAYTFKVKNLKFGIHLSKYDPLMNLQKDFVLSKGERLYGPITPSLYNLYGRLYLLYYQFASDDEDSKMRILLARIDSATLEPGEPKELFDLEQKDMGLFKSMDFVINHTFILTASPDSSKLMLLWNSGKKKDNEYFINVLDRNLDKIWNKKEVIRYSVSEPVFQSACVDNQGNAIVGYKVDGESDYHEGHITVVRPGAGSIDKNIRIAEGRTATILVVPNADGSHVSVTGTYSDKPVYVTGVYTASLSLPDGKMGPVKQTPFPTDLVEKFHQDGWADTKQKRYGLDPIGMQAFRHKDGSIDLVGQCRKRDFIEGFHNSHPLVVSGDLLYVHMGTGAPTFARVPKYRSSAESTIGDSYFAYPVNNHMVLLYNDSQSNLNKDIALSPASSDRYNNVVLVAVIFPANGDTKREKIIDLAKESYLSVTENIQVLSPSSLLIPLQKIKGLGGIGDKSKWANLEIQ